jgi:hypothetical protein
MIEQKCFKEEMHDRIDESSSDALSSYRYEDNQLCESV